jgi:hypothetical protein
MNIRLLSFYADFENTPTLPSWQQSYQPELHRAFLGIQNTNTIRTQTWNRELYDTIFGDWIEEPEPSLEACRADWLFNEVLEMESFIDAYAEEGLGMFAGAPMLYKEFSYRLYRLRDRTRRVQKAIQARVPQIGIRFDPLLILHLPWQTTTVGDLLVSILRSTPFGEEALLERMTFGPFFAGLFVYLDGYKRLDRILREAWTIHMKMEEDSHARSMTALSFAID